MTDTPSSPPDPAAKPLGHAATVGKVQADRTARSLNTAVATFQLAAKGIDPEVITEFTALQMSVLDRFRHLSEGWSKDWQDWFRYATHRPGANTMSKIAEHETNVVCQMTQIMGSQMSDLITLQENIEVNYAYWLKQKLDRPK